MLLNLPGVCYYKQIRDAYSPNLYVSTVHLLPKFYTMFVLFLTILICFAVPSSSSSSSSTSLSSSAKNINSSQHLGKSPLSLAEDGNRIPIYIFSSRSIMYLRKSKSQFSLPISSADSKVKEEVRSSPCDLKSNQCEVDDVNKVMNDVPTTVNQMQIPPSEKAGVHDSFCKLLSHLAGEEMFSMSSNHLCCLIIFCRQRV
ncbi:hypothetical protein Cni_G09905 [Canna indica]|uniref:Uncharacterized protein n=1 Tax=Canna indica TaxID=4628 RepID=A0AAQ3Q6W2_9LILI|nr:hypothetical protein Cni_G09905 [Canna indica]